MNFSFYFLFEESFRLVKMIGSEYRIAPIWTNRF